MLRAVLRQGANGEESKAHQAFQWHFALFENKMCSWADCNLGQVPFGGHTNIFALLLCLEGNFELKHCCHLGRSSGKRAGGDVGSENLQESGCQHDASPKGPGAANLCTPPARACSGENLVSGEEVVACGRLCHHVKGRDPHLPSACASHCSACPLSSPA